MFGFSERGFTLSHFCESIFPIQATVGVGGNIITLMVLLSRPMRSRTNTLLAVAAVCDIMFMLLMIPNNLSRRRHWIYEDCPENRVQNGTRCWTPFFYFYIHSKTTFTFLLNLFSGSSTWFMVAVSFDRLWAIKSPFSARTSSNSAYFTLPLIAIIFVLNAMTTMYMNFSFSVTINGQDEKSMRATQSSKALFIFVLINVTWQIVLPMVLLIVFNSFLIYCLRSRRQFLAAAVSTTERHSSDETPPLLENQRKITTVSRNGTNGGGDQGGWGRQLSKAERHVTLTVALIVSAYLITHLPSAILYTIMYMFNPNTIGDEQWYSWISISSSIVIMGKLMNFFLFCMSSNHFRKQMWQKLFCCCAFFCIRKEGQAPRTRSIPLNQIGDSVSNVPMCA